MLQYVIIILSGTVAGFLNVVAGGGTLVTLPILIFVGLPSAVANGTNRVALIAQNITATINFRHKGVSNTRYALTLAAPAIIGALLGAKLAVSIPDQQFNAILGFVMLGVLALIVWEPQKRLKKPEALKASSLIAMIVFFFIGVYGGFMQAGVGFVIIASLAILTEMSLVEINSVKSLVVLAYLTASLVLFTGADKVNWSYGLALAVGNSLGAWAGSSFSVAKGDRAIKLILVTTVIVMAAKFLGVYSLVSSLF